MEPNLSSDANMNFGTAAGADAGASACQPLQCDKAMGCIDGARNPSTTQIEMGQLRGQLQECTPCLQAFDMELKLRTTMAPTMSELPSPDLAMRITETLASVDLSNLDITDF